MTDSFEALKEALADRYTIVRATVTYGSTTSMLRPAAIGPATV